MHIAKTKFDARLSEGKKLSLKKQNEYGIYFRLWLALLYVVCEQLNDAAESQLLIRPPESVQLWSKLENILESFEKHKDALRIFRNGQFHFQSSPEKQQQFFESKPNRIEWAETLHSLIGKFFSEYRICCGVEYALSGRDSELRDLMGARPQSS